MTRPLSTADAWAREVLAEAGALSPRLFPAPAGVFDVDDLCLMLEQQVADALDDFPALFPATDGVGCMLSLSSVEWCGCYRCSAVREYNATDLRWSP